MNDAVATPSEATPDGEVEITINGKVRMLKPTFGAARTLSAKYGGLQGVVERVARLEMEAVIDVVTLGLGHTQQRRPPPDLAEQIWNEGMTDATGGLAEKCVVYLHILMGGGRIGDPDSSEEEREPVDPQ